MLWRHEVDIVAPLLLQFEHHPCESLRLRFHAVAVLADLEVLAEHALQIAHREKDRAAAVPAAQAILLTEMRKVARHPGVPPGFA